MTFIHAIVLGIVQGLTEFIPVSSTAHLLIMSNVLGISADHRSFAFSVIIQLGTVFALMLYFWKDIWQIIQAFVMGILHRKPFENLYARLGWLVILATIPALIAGFLMKDVVQTMFGSTFTQAGVRLIMTAMLLTIVEYFNTSRRSLESATWLDALSVGFFQVLAIFPGASRSGTTIAGGMARGFDRAGAARFAFLMSGPILLAAGAYETFKVIEMPGTQSFLPYLITGFVSAAIVGWLAIKWLLAYLSRRPLYLFALYCAVLGITVLLLEFR